MKISLPSNRIIALFVIVVALIFASLLVRHRKQSFSSDATEKPTQKTIVARVQTEEIDSDGDGLPDWEEALWKLDPNNPDTDGDGISDYEAKKILEEEQLSQEEELEKFLDPVNDPSWESLSFTEQVSSKMLGTYLSLKQDGGPLTQNDVATLVENIPRYTPPEQLPARIYSATDILSITETNKDALRTYGNAVGTVLSTQPGDIPANEILALASFLQNGDEITFMRDIDEIVSRYETVISGLLQIPVPQTFVPIHLAIINALSLVKHDLAGFYSFTQDPLLALSVFTSYNKSATQRGEAFTTLKTALRSAGVTFSATEPGNVLMIEGTTQM